jgi:hypothetical protein
MNHGAVVGAWNNISFIWLFSNVSDSLVSDCENPKFPWWCYSLLPPQSLWILSIRLFYPSGCNEISQELGRWRCKLLVILEPIDNYRFQGPLSSIFSLSPLLSYSDVYPTSFRFCTFRSIHCINNTFQYFNLLNHEKKRNVGVLSCTVLPPHPKENCFVWRVPRLRPLVVLRWKWVRSIGKIIPTGENRSSGRKTWLSVTLSTICLT